MVLSMYLLHEYKTIEKHFYKLNKYIENTDKKYLLSEIIEQPKYIEAIPYYYILKKASKSMREEINTIKNQKKDAMRAGMLCLGKAACACGILFCPDRIFKTQFASAGTRYFFSLS